MGGVEKTWIYHRKDRRTRCKIGRGNMFKSWNVDDYFYGKITSTKPKLTLILTIMRMGFFLKLCT